jgi:hypothetical protein
MIDSPTSIVLLGSNQNIVGSTSGSRYSSSSLTGIGARVGAPVGIMSRVSIVLAPTICLQWVLGSLGPLNALISSDRSLEIVGALNHLMLQGGKPGSSSLWPWLKLLLNRMEHRSS